jgi:hypothetical protein
VHGADGCIKEVSAPAGGALAWTRQGTDVKGGAC